MGSAIFKGIFEVKFLVIFDRLVHTFLDIFSKFFFENFRPHLGNPEKRNCLENIGCDSSFL